MKVNQKKHLKKLSKTPIKSQCHCPICLRRERHKPHFLELVKNKLDITFANEQEIMSLIDVKKFNEVINFAKEIKLIVITRGNECSCNK